MSLYLVIAEYIRFSEVSISSDWATRAMDILAETDLELDMVSSILAGGIELT